MRRKLPRFTRITSRLHSKRLSAAELASEAASTSASMVMVARRLAARITLALLPRTQHILAHWLTTTPLLLRTFAHSLPPSVEVATPSPSRRLVSHKTSQSPWKRERLALTTFKLTAVSPASSPTTLLGSRLRLSTMMMTILQMYLWQKLLKQHLLLPWPLQPNKLQQRRRATLALKGSLPRFPRMEQSRRTVKMLPLSRVAIRLLQMTARRLLRSASTTLMMGKRRSTRVGRSRTQMRKFARRDTSRSQLLPLETFQQQESSRPTLKTTLWLSNLEPQIFQALRWL